MESGTIVSWVKHEGDRLEEGDLLCEIETDKATMGFETPEPGYLAKILVPEGSKDVPIGRLLCILVENEASVAAFKDFKAGPDDDKSAAGAKKPAAAKPAPAAKKAPEPAPPSAPKAAPAAPSRPKPVAAAASGKIPATPLAKRLAAEKGLDLAALQGSGPGGRVQAADIGSAPALAAAGAPPPSAEGTFTDIPLSNIRKVNDL